MKRVSFAIILILLTGITVSCDSTVTGTKVASIGAPYEVLVICAQEKWDGAIGDTLRSIMAEPVELLNQKEPLFDLMRIVPSQFNSLHRKNRNILNIITGEDHKVPSLTATYDVYASPQIIVTAAGPDNISLTQYISDHRSELQAVFNIAERERALELNEQFGDKELEEKISSAFGFKMHLNKGYKIRNTADDFMWISFEYPTASQGIIIYSYPYSGIGDDFSADSIIVNRNRFVSLIPGENPGSHMTTADIFAPETRAVRINGRLWAETRGFWDVEGDFMGGPFVNYSTVDVENKRVVALDFYVYSPQKNKRNFMRGLETLIYSVSFPSDERAAKGAGM